MPTKASTKNKPAPAEPVRGELIYVDPATLIVAANARTVVSLDPEFLASLTEFGVIQPILGYRVDEQVHVEKGQRRTLGAVKAGLKLVPVIVYTEAEIEARRLLTQMAENVHRDPMTAADKAAALHQLTLIGVAAKDIVHTGVASAAEVKAAARVTKSDKARQAASQYEITVEQSAVIAEFDDDDQAVRQLVDAAPTGQFTHVAQRLRDERTRSAYRTKLIDQLTKSKTPIIEPPAWNSRDTGKVEDLRDRNGAPIDPQEHTNCPGHAAYITTSYGDKEPYRIGYACSDVRRYSHYTSNNNKLRRSDMTADEISDAKAERADVRAGNLAWDSAETVRRDWLRQFATGTHTPKDAARFIAESFACADHELNMALSKGNDFALDLLGIKPKGTQGVRQILAEQISRASAARAQLLGLVLILCAYEQRTGRHSWRSNDDATRRYLHFLGQLGYVLSDIENRACTRTVPVEPGAGDPGVSSSQDDQDTTTERRPATTLNDAGPADPTHDKPATDHDSDDPQKPHGAELAADAGDRDL
jgi:ParB family transcriptional regulator, chromosome partitioning protein